MLSESCYSQSTTQVSWPHVRHFTLFPYKEYRGSRCVYGGAFVAVILFCYLFQIQQCGVFDNFPRGRSISWEGRKHSFIFYGKCLNSPSTSGSQSLNGVPQGSGQWRNLKRTRLNGLSANVAIWKEAFSISHIRVISEGVVELSFKKHRHRSAKWLTSGRRFWNIEFFCNIESTHGDHMGGLRKEGFRPVMSV